MAFNKIRKFRAFFPNLLRRRIKNLPFSNNLRTFCTKPVSTYNRDDNVLDQKVRGDLYMFAFVHWTEGRPCHCLFANSELREQFETSKDMTVNADSCLSPWSE